MTSSHSENADTGFAIQSPSAKPRDDSLHRLFMAKMTAPRLQWIIAQKKAFVLFRHFPLCSKLFTDKHIGRYKKEMLARDQDLIFLSEEERSLIT